MFSTHYFFWKTISNISKQPDSSYKTQVHVGTCSCCPNVKKCTKINYFELIINYIPH